MTQARRDGSVAAVGATFAIDGFVSAASLSRMPSVREQVGATSAQLSVALVCVGIGAVLAMPFTGRLTERFSSANVVRGFALLVLLAYALASFLHGVPGLAACLLAVGCGFGVWDVAMNVQGHTVEQAQSRVLMPVWHALFSFGSVAGAAAGAAFARAGVHIHWQFPVTAVAAAIGLFLCTRAFIHDRAEPALEPAPGDAVPAGAGSSGITRAEVLIGFIVLATALGEGAANDWLGLTLVDDRHVAEAFGALTLAGFNLTMGIGRLVGAGTIRRYGRVAVLRVSGLVASAGVAVLCLINSPVTGLVGAAAWGLGLAVVFPSGMSAAGEVPGRGGRAIATVSTIGYCGFLLGAPLIGQLTRLVALDRALLVVAVMAALIAVLAPVARERGRRPQSTPAGAATP